MLCVVDRGNQALRCSRLERSRDVSSPSNSGFRAIEAGAILHLIRQSATGLFENELPQFDRIEKTQNPYRAIPFETQEFNVFRRTAGRNW